MVGMNKLVSVSPDHLFRSVAQHPFDRGTGIEYCPFRAQEENDVIGVLDQRAEALFARLNRLFRPLAPDELADLAADRGERSELLLIRFPDPATEELDNPQGLPAKQDRASKAGVQPGSADPLFRSEERSELLLIRFPDPATEELDNPQGLPAKQDRASKAGVQPGSADPGC